MIPMLKRLALLLALATAACVPARPHAAPVEAGVDATAHLVGGPLPAYGPVSINGVDAGRLPAMVLTPSALPHCDGGGYVPADGGMRCGAVVTGLDAAVSLPLIGNGTAAHPITTESCDAGEFLGVHEAGVPHCSVPPVGITPHGTDGGGIVFDGAAGYLSPLCDGGMPFRPAGGGPWTCLDTPIPVADTVAKVVSVDGTGLISCATTSGVVSCTATSPVAVVNGGTGNAMACGVGNVVQAASSTALTCNPLTGDGTISTGGALTNTGVQGGTAGAHSFSSTTGLETIAAGATAPGITQASTTGVTPATMSHVSQASTDAAGVGGTMTYTIPNPGTGNYGQHVWYQGTTPIMAVGMPTNPIYNAHTGLWMATGTFGVSNMILDVVGGTTGLYAGTEINMGDGSNTRLGVTSSQVFVTSGLNFNIGGSAIAAGGVGVVGLARATTNPTATSTGTVIYSDSSTGALRAWGGLDTDTLQSPTAIVGTNYSALESGKGPRCEFTVGGATSSSGSCTLTVPARQSTYGSTVAFDVRESAKCVIASGAAPCIVGSASTSPDAFVSQSFGLAGKMAPDGTFGSYHTPATPVAVIATDTNTSTAACSESVGTNTVTVTCSNVVTQTGTFMWVVSLTEVDVQ